MANYFYYILKLLDLYPDRTVIKLGKYNLRLYRDIVKEAKKNDKSISQFMEELGFKYVDEDIIIKPSEISKRISSKNNQIPMLHDKGIDIERDYTDAMIAMLLIKKYPDRKIYMLKKVSPSIYDIILVKSKNRGMKTTEYLNQLGFTEYNNKKEFIKSIDKINLKACIETSESYFSKIDKNNKEEFDNTIKTLCDLAWGYGISLQQCMFIPRLYEEITNRISEENITLNEYFSRLNLPTIDSWIYPTISELLSFLYPNRNITGLSLHPTLHRYIYLTSKEKNMTIEEYVGSLGFEIDFKGAGGYKKNVATDNENISRLKHVFIKALNNVYPDGNYKVPLQDDYLSAKALILSRKMNMTVTELLENIKIENIENKSM